MSTAKRIFFYVVCLITLYTLAQGVYGLLQVCLDLISGQSSWLSYTITEFSMGLASLIIGGVLWYLFWRAVRRQVADHPTETGSAIRKLYLNVVLLVAAFAGLFGAAAFIRWLMSGVPLVRFPSAAFAELIVSGGIWYYHRRVEEGEGQPSASAKTLKRWYVYILAGFGLTMLASSIIHLLDAAIFHLPVWGDIARGAFWNSSVQGNITWILLGSCVWVHYWFYVAKGDTESTLRWVYYYLLAIPGGAIAGLTALVIFLYKILMVIFSGTGLAGASYFIFLGWTIPTVIVAAAILIYHRKAVQEETIQVHKQQLSAQRIFQYLMSFIGLGTLVAGLIILLGVLLDVIINAASQTIIITAGWWYEQISLGLALMVVATPIWLYYWKQGLKMAAEGGALERGARSRRIYLYIVLGIAIITLAAVVVNLVYQLINGLLQGNIGVGTLHDMKWSLQALLIPLPVLLYHWQVLREDRRLGAEGVLPRKRVTMLAGEQMVELIARLEEKLGSRIIRLRQLSVTEAPPVLSDEELDKLVNEIGDAPGAKIMLVVKGSNIMVLPYEDR